MNMSEIKQWGEEAREIVYARKKVNRARQKIKFGSRILALRKSEPLRISDFFIETR